MRQKQKQERMKTFLEKSKLMTFINLLSFLYLEAVFTVL